MTLRTLFNYAIHGVSRVLPNRIWPADNTEEKRLRSSSEFGPVQSRRKHLATLGTGFLAAATIPFSANAFEANTQTSPPSMVKNPSSERELKTFLDEAMSPLREALLKFDDVGLKSVRDKSIYFNQVSVALSTGGKVGIDSNNERKILLEAGLEMNGLPPWLIHEVIYSSGKCGEYLSTLPQNETTNSKKRELYEILVKYLDTNKAPSNVIAFAIAKLSNDEDIKLLQDQFIAQDSIEVRSKIIEIFTHVNSKADLMNSSERFTAELKRDIHQRTSDMELIASRTSGNGGGDDNKDSEVGSLSLKERNFIAKGIEILSLSDETVNDAIETAKEYFQKINPNRDEDADYLVLESLGNVKDINKTKGLLKEIAHKNTELFFNAYLCGNDTSKNSPQAQAGRALTKLFNENPNVGKEILTSTYKSLEGKTDERSIKGRSKVIQTIACLNTLRHDEELKGLLRSVVENKSETADIRAAAMIGLGRIKDVASLEPLLRIASDTNLQSNLRGEALYNIALIDAPDYIPLDFEEDMNKDRPYGLETFYFNFSEDPDIKIRDWHLPKKLLNRQLNPEETMGRKLSGIANDLDDKFGGSTGKLKELASKSGNYSKYFAPIEKYLSDCRESEQEIDFNLAIPGIFVLSKAGKGSSVLSDMCSSPDRYVENSTPGEVIANATEADANANFLKLISIQGLSSAIDLEKPQQSIPLHSLVQEDSASMFYIEALQSELELAHRYEHEISKSNGDKKNSLIDVSSFHGNRMVHCFEVDIVSKKEAVADWSVTNYRRFLTALSAIKFNEGRSLVNTAFKRGWVKKDNEHIRIIVYAFLAAGYKLEDIGKLDIEDGRKKELKEVFEHFESSVAYFGDTFKKKKHDAKHLQFGIIDGGDPTDSWSKHKDSIKFTEGAIGPSLYAAKSKHTSTVLETISDRVENFTAHIGTWDSVTASQDSLLRNDRYDPMILATEDMIGKNLTGKSNIKFINGSFGIKSKGLMNNRTYRDYANRRAAYVDLGARCAEIEWLTSAGNDSGKDPTNSRNGEIGEVSALGLYVKDNGRFESPKGLFKIEAYDHDLGEKIPTSGNTDPLGSSNLQLTRAYAFTLMHKRVRGRQFKTFYGATSFATPNHLVKRIIEST